jgi:hypothetical protein
MEMNAVRESNPAEVPAPGNFMGVEPTAPAFLWRTAPRRKKPNENPRCRYRLAIALVQLRAHYNHCGEAASEECLSTVTFVTRRLVELRLVRLNGRLCPRRYGGLSSPSCRERPLGRPVVCCRTRNPALATVRWNQQLSLPVLATGQAAEVGRFPQCSQSTSRGSSREKA